MLITEKAEEVLASISVRIIPEIIPEDYEYLKKLCMERKESDLVEFPLLCEKLRHLADREFEEVKYNLLNIAYEYGNWIIANFGGQWGSFYEQFGIIDVGPESSSGNVIHQIYLFWKRKLSFEEMAVKSLYCIPFENEFCFWEILDEDYKYLQDLSENANADSQVTLDQLQERIDILKGKNSNNIKNELLMIAVDLGNCLIAEYGGRWGKIESSYGVKQVGCSKSDINVICEVYYCWGMSLKIDRDIMEDKYLLTNESIERLNL